MESIELRDDQVVEALMNWIAEADADELARVLGEVFGGSVTYGNEIYTFHPDPDEYCNGLDHFAEQNETERSKDEKRGTYLDKQDIAN